MNLKIDLANASKCFKICFKLHTLNLFAKFLTNSAYLILQIIFSQNHEMLNSREAL